jgi:hypothetical protein
MTPAQVYLNAEKSLALAKTLFPFEEWVPKEDNIWVAKSRLVEEYREPEKWEREMSQVRILTNRTDGNLKVALPFTTNATLIGATACCIIHQHGFAVRLTAGGSVAYFLPEKIAEGEAGLRCADTVIDGEITELKTVTGTGATLSKDFKKGYKQGASLIKSHTDVQSHSVFIRLFSDLPEESVKAKIAGELKTRYDRGRFICFFETTSKLQQWAYSELRAMIGKK